MLERVALRYCVSKAMAEVLLAASGRVEPAIGVIRRCQSRISAAAEEAMEGAMKGQPGPAAERLLATGEATLNAKLLEMAGLIARRHQAAIPGALALAERAAELVRRSCRSSNHIAGIERSGRSPGGLQVRGHNAVAADAA
jgi:hypothetical protein